MTNDPAMARKVRLLQELGRGTRYEHSIKAFNYRMDGIQGAILRVKLRYLERWTEAASRACGRATAACSPDAGIGLPDEQPECRHVYHVFAVRLQRSGCRPRDHLQAAGIQTGVHYPIPVHLQPAYADLGYHARRFSGVGSGRPRSAVAPDVSRTHAGAARNRRLGGSGCGGRRRPCHE